MHLMLDVHVHKRLVTRRVQYCSKAIAKVESGVERIGIIEGRQLVVQHDKVEEADKGSDITFNRTPPTVLVSLGPGVPFQKKLTEAGR